ncbi:VPDSG-CTERM sorting domain-containing protein [bacterium]|nr:VPDSG-CTERM sorting domain-containing protein [bacterium]
MKKTSILIATAVLAFTFQSRAALISLAGTQYEVSSLATTYNNSISLLTSQPWWGSSDDAKNAAIQTANSLALSDGPWFLYGISGNSLLLWDYSTASTAGNGSTFSIGSLSSSIFDYQLNFAVAEAASSSVPDGGASLALLGLGFAALAVTRRKMA